MDKSKRLYPPLRYDKHYRLKLPFILWGLAIWAILPLVMFFPRAKRTAGIWGDVLGDWGLLTSSASVLFILLVYGHRVPDAGRFWRLAWQHGRTLLFVGMTIGALILAWRHTSVLLQPGHYLFEPLGLILAVQLLFLGYVGLCGYLHDLFADFPELNDDLRVRALPLVRSTPVSPGEMHYQEAQVHLKAKRLDDALIALRESLIRDPQHIAAWKECAKLLAQMGYAEEAKQAQMAADEAKSK